MVRRIFLARLILIVIATFFSCQLKAQLIINEFMASNTGAFVDPDYDESADWVELYNSGSAPIQLKGYYLTDNISDPSKWEITSAVEIAPGEYLIIWADGMDAGLHTNFKLSADGEELAIFSPSLVIVDSVTFESQSVNVSCGRKSPLSDEWAFFTEPTPGQANNSISFDGVVKSSPDFSIKGGIYNNPISLKLSTLFGGLVRYTLDGSEPNESSPLAGDEININQNTVVRARIFKDGQLPGSIVSHSYFITNGNTFHNLPIISIVSAPDNFWGEENGIYVQDFKPDWEVPVNIELFENDGSDRAAFNVQAGIKINGLYSWQLPQKMLGVYFRKEYGSGKLEYPIIFDKARKQYDTFALRASGSDWGNTLFRDGMIQNSTLDYTSIDNSGFRACVVYINGQYMGVHNIREKIDEDYVVSNHGVKAGSFDMVEETDKGHYAEAGDLVANQQFLNLVSKDLTVQANWDTVASLMDIDEFTDMVCTEVYSENGSIGHNLMKWKPKDSGKWRWILMDLDRGFSNVNGHLISFYEGESDWPFRNLMKNPDYKKKFGLRLADHLFTSFNKARIIPLIEKHKQTIAAEIPNHTARWEGTSGTGNYSSIDAIPSVDYWLDEVEELKTFAKNRSSVLLNNLTSYGFERAAPVTVSSYPQKSGKIIFNGLKVPADFCEGGYPSGEVIKLVAEPYSGFVFKGWKTILNYSLIEKESEWRYYDNGEITGETWRNDGYDDSSWKTGQAELGYGDDDENTVIDFGSNSQRKHITSYFRKAINIDNPEQFIEPTLQLKCDDGAVVYINGKEAVRFNLPEGEITFNSNALTPIGSGDEDVFNRYTIEKNLFKRGENIIAVEVHQSSATSSDLSFDLAIEALSPDPNQYISTTNELTLTLQPEGININAVFEADGKCIVPEEISTVITLEKECSPYVVPNNVTISPEGKLIIEEGVKIWLSDGVSIYVSGSIQANGTNDEPIIFESNPESRQKKWGILSFINASDTSRFSNVIIRDASKGLHPVREIAAISGFHSTIELNNIEITDVHYNPILSRYSDVKLTNSKIRSKVTGDGINIKYGKGYIDNCEFIGNNQVDSDGIDYDNITGGVIKNCLIHDFYGFNSDALDIGEATKNLTVENLTVYKVKDKGVSVGQRSSATITNSIFVNCDMGAGLKDSSKVTIDHCTYYGNRVGIASYEKNPGDAGANVTVTNSIISNSYDAGVSSDKYSKMLISYSNNDTEEVEPGNSNIHANPLFHNPESGGFSLLEGSLCINAGNDGNMGAGGSVAGLKPGIIIRQICYYTDTESEDIEFIALYNFADSSIDLQGFKFVKGITFTFPENSSINPGGMVYVTSKSSSSFWSERNILAYQWESGRLADEGEAIRLVDKSDMIVDQVTYNNKKPWPIPRNAQQGITLSRYDVDNHFGEYWRLQLINEMVNAEKLTLVKPLNIYPNPTTGKITLSAIAENNVTAEVYNMQGVKVKTVKLINSQKNIDLSALEEGLYVIRAEGKYGKIAIKK